MNVIEISNLTKDYGSGKGIFDISMSVKKGEVFGFLGPNGAGKTTTIRNLLGFIRPDKGVAIIDGKDCFRDASVIQRKLGYLAGEIVFPDDMTGVKLLNFLADLKGLQNRKRMDELIRFFDLNPTGKVKKMSKGMKQKIGIINAFMGEPEILIMDEPTSGLDPLMQNRFVELILQEKKKGTTIMMSSHIFEEIERTCDRTAIIREGKLVAIEDMEGIKAKKSKKYQIIMNSAAAVEEFAKENYRVIEKSGNSITISVKGEVLNFLKKLSEYPVVDMDIKTPTLEEIFLHYYGGEN